MDDCNIFEIWEEYKSSLFGYIKKRVTDEDDAKDILQDVLLKSYQYCSNGKTVLYLNDYATTLYMSDIDGTDQKTIAENLGLTLPNTKSRIQRARVKLKERFLECCVVSFGESGEMVSFDIKPQCKELQAEKKRLENIF